MRLYVKEKVLEYCPIFLYRDIHKNAEDETSEHLSLLFGCHTLTNKKNLTEL